MLKQRGKLLKCKKYASGSAAETNVSRLLSVGRNPGCFLFSECLQKQADRALRSAYEVDVIRKFKHRINEIFGKKYIKIEK